MKRLLSSLAVSICLLLVVSHINTATAKDTWVSVRTKNFFMLGNASEKDIRRVGLKLEQFRDVFTHLFPGMRFSTPVPTTVVVFKDDNSFGPFKPGPRIAGYFQAGDDVNYIALTTEERGEQDPFNVIFHEYTHLLINNTFPTVPTWFNEGLAEYYSTFNIADDQKVTLGAPISNHVLLLRQSKMLPLRTLFAVDPRSPHYNETNKQSIFYAQSWALMHYLVIGKQGRVEQLGKFIELLSRKLPMEQAFQQAFETPFEVMEKELRSYIQKDRYAVVTGHFERKLELDTATEATPLTEAEVQAYLGDLLMHSHRKNAYTYLEKAVKLDPNLAMAHASLGMSYFYEGKVQEAHASLERAVAANSNNYLAHYYYAFTLFNVASGDGAPVAGYPPEMVAKIREHLQKAIALRPDYPESYELLGLMSLVTGKEVDESIASLKKVLSESPGRQDLTLTLAQLYLRKQDNKTARQLLEQVANSNVDERRRSFAATLLKQIDDYESAVELSKANNTPQGREAETVVPAGSRKTTQTAAPAPDPSSYLREVLRPAADGETQLQATLAGIECDAKGMVFVIHSAGGPLRLRAATFDDVEITTYDPTVKGEITCGARNPANTVVVDYVAGADKKLKVDGVLKSIEFVPADFKLKP